MTAKEEAQRLVEMFKPYSSGLSVISDTEVDYSFDNVNANAKQCAIACVYEVIKRLNEVCYNNGLNDNHELEQEFAWLENIKQEIESL